MGQIKIRVRNLGSIKDARLRLGNLTIFVGKNNTNKTWTAYVLHAISSDFMMEDYINDLEWNRRLNLKLVKTFVEKYLSIIEKFIEEHSQGKPLKASVFTSKDIEYLKLLTADYLNFVNSNFHKFISIDRALVENLKISFYWPRRKEDINKLIERINTEFVLILKKHRPQNKEFIFPFDRIYYLIFITLQSVIKSVIGNPFNLPVERNTLITFSNLISLGEGTAPTLRELRYKIFRLLKEIEKHHPEERSRLINTIKEELSDVLFSLATDYYRYNYPFPIKRFKDFTLRLPSLSPKEESLNKLLLDYLEKILEGNIKFDSRTGITYKNDKATTPILLSSSMVKSLGGLYAYVAYKAQENDFLIIDEPENNLHPEAQVKLIEFLSVMANKGIRVLATTHSPYIVDHLVNLIEASNSKKKSIEELFFLKTKDAFIRREAVAVYLFHENGEVENILSENGLINWETFSKVSEEIADLYYKI